VATTFRMSSAHPFTERSANGRGYLRFIYDTFLRYDGDLNLIPWAAESYKLASPTSYDLKIRSGMKWHDGKPVTVDDAKFTFDYLLKWKPPFWDSFMNPVKSAEILDSTTLRVRLHGPSATFATLSLVQIALLPKHVWENVPEKAGVSTPMEWDAPGKGGMIGSGPFKFVGFQKDVDC
jgi:peptide/nickel transport system substrate-binding protein